MDYIKKIYLCIFIFITLISGCNNKNPANSTSDDSQFTNPYDSEIQAEINNQTSPHVNEQNDRDGTVSKPLARYISMIGITADELCQLVDGSSYSEWIFAGEWLGSYYYEDETLGLYYLFSVEDTGRTPSHVLTGDKVCRGVAATIARIFPEIAVDSDVSVEQAISKYLQAEFAWAIDEVNDIYTFYAKYGDGQVTLIAEEIGVQALTLDSAFTIYDKELRKP